MSILDKFRGSSGRHARRASDPAADAPTGTSTDRPSSTADSGERASGAGADGPFDVADVGGPDGRVDVGALWLRGIPGLELRLELDQHTREVHAATAVLGESALQLQAFAAPRSSGLWDEIRAEISATIEKQGGTVEQVDGVMGAELRTRMPSADPDGRTVFAPATFLGVDGPRWFLRGVLSGRAAIDSTAAAPLIGVMRDTVVVRGLDPMAPRELLPLTLPGDGDAVGGEGDTTEERPGLDPFQRGPEITEVR
ncbi:MAG: DUF3710 domain-containing protein [Dermatophilaceae bacterium]